MGLLQAIRVQKKVRYCFHKVYSHRDIELDCESDIDEFGPNIVVRVFQNPG